ncbi:Ctf8-domain-containing protein [Fomes fomentarius]|nr:Ctf8-domain-containing protein [Fomes fomentarius]
MLIPIHFDLPGPSSSQHRQLPPQLVQFGSEGLLLIELQGALEVEGDKNGQLVGKLRVDPATNKPTLMIGHHLLEGKLVNLAKPLAVLHKHKHGARSPSVDGGEGESADSAMDVDDRLRSTEAKSWDVVAIVKRKMVFATRPMPIVGKSSSAAPLSRVGSKV